MKNIQLIKIIIIIFEINKLNWCSLIVKTNNFQNLMKEVYEFGNYQYCRGGMSYYNPIENELSRFKELISSPDYIN